MFPLTDIHIGTEAKTRATAGTKYTYVTPVTHVDNKMKAITAIKRAVGALSSGYDWVMQPGKPAWTMHPP